MVKDSQVSVEEIKNSITEYWVHSSISFLKDVGIDKLVYKYFKSEKAFKRYASMIMYDIAVLIDENKAFANTKSEEYSDFMTLKLIELSNGFSDFDPIVNKMQKYTLDEATILYNTTLCYLFVKHYYKHNLSMVVDSLSISDVMKMRSRYKIFIDYTMSLIDHACKLVNKGIPSISAEFYYLMNTASEEYFTKLYRKYSSHRLTYNETKAQCLFIDEELANANKLQ